MLQPDMGIPISLLDIERYTVPAQKVPMDPADAALLEVKCCIPGSDAYTWLAVLTSSQAQLSNPPTLEYTLVPTLVHTLSVLSCTNLGIHSGTHSGTNPCIPCMAAHFQSLLTLCSAATSCQDDQMPGQSGRGGGYVRTFHDKVKGDHPWLMRTT
jgi:hypothetical protein